MKSTTKITRLALIAISLLLFTILTALNFPLNSTRLQAEASPTPTPTQLLVNGEPVLQSGDTEGLILGAGVILIIILAGVFIQRLIQNKHAPGSPEDV